MQADSYPDEVMGERLRISLCLIGMDGLGKCLAGYGNGNELEILWMLLGEGRKRGLCGRKLLI